MKALSSYEFQVTILLNSNPLLIKELRVSLLINSLVTNQNPNSVQIQVSGFFIL